jgi:hypothetical protein
VSMAEVPGVLAAWDREPAKFGKIVVEVA